jgi:hypothetical protein
MSGRTAAKYSNLRRSRRPRATATTRLISQETASNRAADSSGRRGSGAKLPGVRRELPRLTRLLDPEFMLDIAKTECWARMRVVARPRGASTTSRTCLARGTTGGAPAFLLGDNAKTVTVEHVAGVDVRHPTVVAAGRHHGATVYSCEPFDPESKGGVEATVRIAKADLVSKETNLRGEYGSFTELVAAGQAWCEHINARVHRETVATGPSGT